MSSVNIQVYYAKGIRIHLKNRTLKEALQLIFESRTFSDFEPLKIVFPETKKTLYADRQLFLNYLNAEISLETLIENTQCDELYRNTNDIVTDDLFTVEKGSLWKASGKELTLVDDDNQVNYKLIKLLFETVE